MDNIIDGKKIANRINKKTTAIISNLSKQGFHPELAVVLIGDDKPSKLYVRNKERAAKKVGITFTLHHLPFSSSNASSIDVIKKIQTKKTISGLIVQLPIPKKLNTWNIINSINPAIDVDCLTNYNAGALFTDTHTISPPTPAAVLEILSYTKTSVRGKHIVLVGQGLLVGKPLSILLTHQGATITACNSKTKNLKQICKTADVIISGVGKRNLITGDMIKKDVVIIDAGINFVKDKWVGDVEFETCAKKAKHITPTPGGVGPVTVAKLLYNTAICAQQKYKEQI